MIDSKHILPEADLAAAKDFLVNTQIPQVHASMSRIIAAHHAAVSARNAVDAVVRSRQLG